MTDSLIVRGARQHNLKNIDVCLPRGRLVVVTGPSGSGKSSLAFDTIHAEGQRRYVESLSMQARQHLGRLPRPKVDLIEGLSPTIGVQAGGLSQSPRSTVGSVTEIADLLRLLLARLGQQHCPKCGQRVVALTVPQMTDRVLARSPGLRFSVRAKIARDMVGDLAAELAALRREGFVRVVVDGRISDLAELAPLSASRAHSLDVDVDRLAVKPEARGRLADSLELGLRVGKRVVLIAFEDGETLELSDRLICTRCGLEQTELTPGALSWNGQGACDACGGLGVRLRFDPERVVPDGRLSLREGAIAPWGSPGRRYHASMLERLLSAQKVDADKPWQQLPKATRTRILQGGGSGPHAYEGVIPGLERRLRELAQPRGDHATLEWMEQELEPFMAQERCDVCHGTRLSARALAVRLDDASLHDLSVLQLDALAGRLQAIRWSPAESAVAEPIVREIDARLAVLVDLGVGYLNLARESRGLSRGEAERIRLAAHLGAGLTGVVYVLDEPTTGLHARDTERLVGILRALCARGNSVIVVEHDLDVIAAADHVIDMGPLAGEHGGQVIASGPPAQIAATPGAPTGRFLAQGRGIDMPARVRDPASRFISIRDARTHNLRGVDADIPIARLTCVSGVSGSGKSSLIMHTLVPAAQAALRGVPMGVAASISGLEAITRVVHVDQSPIGRTPRSNPATYTGLLTPIRELFASLPEARARGFGPERFSFNIKGGRCEQCQGAGQIRVEMQFLPDVYMECDVCHGARYERETLEVRYRGRNIAEVLATSVDEAAELFTHLPRVAETLASLRMVGLGYLELGQSATTLSAGEAQRLRLARELARHDHGATLYALDEPTAGLHLSEIELLAHVLDDLIDKGHTVVVIEHNLELAKRADHVIDLGPEGGSEGGRVIASGPPGQLARSSASHTGRALAARLAAHPSPR
jgi:excinuclease ABC subunit A